MKARDVLDHFYTVGTWINRERTCDRFLGGDPEIEVAGIAIAWTTTNASLEKAADAGCNLYVAHEPCWYGKYEGHPTHTALVEKKRKLIADLGMAVLRCHDTWDRMPEVGIPAAWAKHLGFEFETPDPNSYYRVSLVGETTLEALAREVKERVADLGQDTVLYFGDPERKVSRMAVGTGAITRLPQMHDLDCDVILATDDGVNWWDGGLWATDLGMPLLVVNHCTAEKPGMMAMAGYLTEKFPGVPVRYIDVEYPYKSV